MYKTRTQIQTCSWNPGSSLNSLKMSADMVIIDSVATSVSYSIQAISATLIPIIIGALATIPRLLQISNAVGRARDEQELVEGNRFGPYDFIVVGAGSAGSVVANRLSEHFNVLLIERGGEPHLFNCIPQLAPSLLNYPETDYMYRSVPQTSSCLGLNNQQSSWSRGMGLGGSSNLNLMVWLRGHPRDYDNWANFTGDPRWSYENIVPFFKKAEHYCWACEKYPQDVVELEAHSEGGPMWVGKPSYTPLVNEFLDAATWDGIPTVDLNGHYTIGAARTTYAEKDGHRWTTYRAYIEPVRQRPTLNIIKQAQVTRVLFRPGTTEAYGVEFHRQGKLYQAYATKEVVLSAGALDSPKILLLSGIGPSEDLMAQGIQPLLDLPVGRNLQDHIGVMPGPFIVDAQRTTFVPERDISHANLAVYLADGTGSISSTGIHANAFFTSYRAIQDGEPDWPDTQYMFSGVGTSPEFIDQHSHAFNLRRDILERFQGPLGIKDSFFYTVMLSRPKQRGELRLVSPDFRDDLYMDPKYFQDPLTEDIQVMVEGIKRVVHMSEYAPSFRRLGARLNPIPYPPCARFIFRSDAYWECYARHYSVSIYHYSGTTAMGPVGDPLSVVDSELRVIGASRLRVIDTGIMPFVVTVNTNAPTVLIGERGAQFILDTWLAKSKDGKSNNSTV